MCKCRCFVCVITTGRVKTKATGDGAFTVTIPTFPARPFELVMEHGRPRFITPIASQAAVAERAFLETKVGLGGGAAGCQCLVFLLG